MVAATVGVLVIGSEGLPVLHYSSAELRQLRSTNERRHVVVNDVANLLDALIMAQCHYSPACQRLSRRLLAVCHSKVIHDSPLQLGLQHSPPAPLLPQHIPVIMSDRNGVRGRCRRAEDYRRSSSATAIDCVAYCSTANCRRSFPTL